MSYFNSPAQQLFLELSRAQGDLNQKRQEEWATPEIAAAMAQYSILQPLGSSALGLALAQGGVPAGDPLAGQLVQQELAIRDTIGPVEQEGEGFFDDLAGIWTEAVWEPVKGTTRWAMSAWDAAYNMVAGGAPIRALMLSKNEEISFKEAWLQQDPFFFEALGGLVAGERVNLGSGFLPDSDVAPDVAMGVHAGMQEVEQATQGMSTQEKYRTRLEAAPGVWNKAITSSAEQAAMGSPLTELSRAVNESVMFAIPRLGGETSYTPWSPGRIASATIWEPGSQGFKYASGTGDFLAQIFADPVDYLGLGWAKMGRAGRLLKSESYRAADEVLALTDDFIGPVKPKALPATAGKVTGQYNPDGTRALARNLKIEGPQPQRALPVEGVPTPAGRITPEGIVTLEPTAVPWWRSPGADAKPLTAFDPPSWYVDLANRVRNSVRGRHAATSKVKGRKTPKHWNRKGAGNYTLDLPRIPGTKQAQVKVRKVGKGKKSYWDVQTPEGKLHRQFDDPRFTEGPKGFATLDEAQKAANSYAYGSPERLKVHGMSPDEFEASGEAFYIQDGQTWLKNQVSIGPSQDEALSNLRRVNRSRPFDDNNIKIVVYGRTADLADRKVADKPAGLIDALRRDKKIRGDNIAGNPSVDSFVNTRLWMENHGYGKLDLGNDDVLIADKYIGGDPADATQRFFTERPREPLVSMNMGDELGAIDSTTADEVNDIIEWYARTGEAPDEVIDIVSKVDGVERKGMHEIAERWREFRNSEIPPPELGGVRVDWDEEQVMNLLKGKRADMFSARLASTTRAAGQKDRVAMDKLLGFLKRMNINMSPEYRRALFEAPNEASVRAIFARMMTEQMGGELLLPGRGYGRFATAGYKIGGSKPYRPMGIKWEDKPFFARRASMMLPNKEVNLIDDPAAAYNVLDSILPNYNVKRGATYTLSDGTVLEVEKVMDSLLDLKPGQDQLAYNAMRDFSQVLFASLTDSGVGDELARHVTGYIGEMDEIRSYNMARLGQGNIKNGAVDGIVVDDILIGGLDGPQITDQAWNGAIHFPDAHTVKVIANESDGLGRVANRLATKFGRDDAGRLEVERRAWNLFMTNTMNRVWKPFVLLRGAWTLRILADDQLRIAADGYTSMFQSPLRLINYALTQPKEFEVALKKGLFDVFGEEIALKNVTNLMHGDKLRAAMMTRGDPRIGMGSYGYKHRTPFPKGHALYAEGQATDIRLLRGDQITSALAGSKAEDPVMEVTGWLMGKGDARTRTSWLDARTRLATFNRRLPEDVQRAILAGDEQTIYKLVSHQDAMMRQTVGGRVVYDDGAGVIRDYSQFRPVDDIESTMDGVPKWRVIEGGDQDLLDIIAKRTSAIGDLNSDESMKGLQAMLKTKVKDSPNRFPNMVSVSDVERVGSGASVRGDYDKAVNMFYEWFMTKPSDTFSRVPLFRQAYWRKMGHVFPNYDDVAQKTMRARAKSAGALDELTKGIKETGAGAKGVKLTDLAQADEYAKAYGLSEVQKTLFDLINKRNISESLNLVFPFVEAWGEFVTRWGRMMVTGDRNIHNMRRLQQGIEGLREDSGFFHENDFGQEVFTYPAFLKKSHIAVHNTLNNIPGLGAVMGADVDPAMSDAIKMEGNAKGLNFASGLIPGFGPVFQMAAKAIPDDPGFDFIRDIVAPYGTQGTISPFMPAWVKRVVSAHGGASDPTLQYAWTATVQDVMRTMMDNGDFAGVTSAEDVDELVKKAEDKARGLLMVRAAATWWIPTAPGIQWTKEDVNGDIWSYSNLGTEYRKIKEEVGGGDTAAFDEFYRRFGFLPAPFSRGDTYPVTDRSLTEEGGVFQRENETLFARYPLSAMYLDPKIGAEGQYDHAAMLSQLQRSEREQWTAEQMVYLQQDQYGDLMWDNANEQAMLRTKGEVRNAYLAESREAISRLYPFWNKQIPGKRQGARNDEQMAEVISWTQDESLIGTSVVIAVRQYLRQRDEVLGFIEQAGAKTIDGPTGSTTAGQIATLGREWLRDEAEILSQKYPEFDAVFMAVFYSEVSESHDALPEVLPEATDAWGEGDIIESVLGVSSG